MSASIAGVREEDGKVYVGVDWDEGYCERELTVKQAMALLEALKWCIQKAKGKVNQ